MLLKFSTNSTILFTIMLIWLVGSWPRSNRTNQDRNCSVFIVWTGQSVLHFLWANFQNDRLPDCPKWGCMDFRVEIFHLNNFSDYLLGAGSRMIPVPGAQPGIFRSERSDRRPRLMVPSRWFPRAWGWQVRMFSFLFLSFLFFLSFFFLLFFFLFMFLFFPSDRCC